MKKYLLLAALSAVATAGAAPALAQYRAQPGPYASPNPYGAYSPQRLIERLAARIEASMRNGRLSRFEGQRLRGEADRLRRLDYQYRFNGMTRLERGDLARRIDALRDNVLAAERRGYVGVPGRDRGYDPLDDGGDIFTDFDRNDDGWDDRDIDRDGRWDDDRSDLDPDLDGREFDRDPQQFESDEPRDEFEPLPPPDADDRLDYDDPGEFDEAAADADYEDFAVGDRAPADLDPVPAYLRSRYRDGGGLHYRYRDGTIFQIDSRTNLIRWMADIPE